jgi:hypothetical protein
MLVKHFMCFEPHGCPVRLICLKELELEFSSFGVFCAYLTYRVDIWSVGELKKSLPVNT